MAFFKEFNIALTNENIDFLTESVTDDIIWSIVGGRKIEGKKEFKKNKRERGNRINT